jgi:hypothetical protein
VHAGAAAAHDGAAQPRQVDRRVTRVCVCVYYRMSGARARQDHTIHAPPAQTHWVGLPTLFLCAASRLARGKLHIVHWVRVHLATAAAAAPAAPAPAAATAAAAGGEGALTASAR